MEENIDNTKKRSSKKSLVILILVVAIALAVVSYLLLAGFTIPSLDRAAPVVEPAVVVKSSDYQAVFLVNNQVYFGKITNSLSSQFVELEDIYYLHQQVQPTTKKNPDPEPILSLIKLGAELHGPTDKMYINRDQILLVEDLRSDSNVVKSIANYQQNKK